jgi:hypothetical protein
VPLRGVTVDGASTAQGPGHGREQIVSRTVLQ